VTLGPGALVWAGFDGPEAPGAILDAIGDGRVGGLILFAYRDNLRSSAQVRAMLRDVQAAARRGGLPPVPVSVDQEGGSVVRVGYRAVFPSAMAIGATGDPALAERAASLVAEGLRADGIGVNHAPVCDLNTQARNPVIGTRAFGDDPERVAPFVAAWVRGSEAAGVASTAKHFPGHGEAPVDPHGVRVDVDVDRATLERRELVPFRAAIAAGTSLVMTAHVRYLAIDDAQPATLSHRILTDLLRSELGFRGLCATDSLDMRGIAVDAPRRVVQRALAAGVDTAIIDLDREAQLAAAGWIAESVDASRVSEAIARATTFRGRFAREVPEREIDDAPARALATEIAARSITHVGSALPRLDRTFRVLIQDPASRSPVEELSDPAGSLESVLRLRFGDRARIARGMTPPPGDGPLVLCTFSASFDAARVDLTRRLVAEGAMLCALRSPYDAALVPGTTALLSYSDVPASLEALVAVLAGAAPATGRLPIRLGAG
jgi:beta-N-acetylhexosaminidase